MNSNKEVKPITITPIGYVVSNFRNNKDIKQHLEYETTGISDVVILEPYVEGLSDLADNFSHVWVIYWMHQVAPDSRHTLKRYPANDKTQPMVGVFACSADVRPNPIGITPCRIIKIQDNRITLMGLDALDSSPVLDIKPYCLQYYGIKGARCPEWTRLHQKGPFKDEL